MSAPFKQKVHFYAYKITVHHFEKSKHESKNVTNKSKHESQNVTNKSIPFSHNVHVSRRLKSHSGRSVVTSSHCFSFAEMCFRRGAPSRTSLWQQ